MEKKQIFKKSIFIAVIVILIMVALSIMLKYEVEGEKSLPYEIEKILMVSTVDGDFTDVDRAAEISPDEVKAKAEYLKTVDFSTADMVVIMYDLSDYVDHRPVVDPNDPENLLTFTGALQASVKMIQEKYPYIRIVVLSTPACGMTVDDYYVLSK